jgi:acetyltransferase
MTSPLHPVLEPGSIAIVGASSDPTKRGNQAIRTLVDNSFHGAIYPINPKETSIRGLDCYASIDDLPATPDLALICTPARTLPDIIRSCGAKGIKGAVVLASGFSESGPEGAEYERQMVQAAKEFNVRLVGPNTSGIFNTTVGANIVGYRGLQKGSIGLLSQSGNMALALVVEGTMDKLGFSTYVGVGNESDIQFHEYLEFYQKDKATKVVVGYVEGLKSGRAFLETAARVCAEKPVVLYKSGRSAAGQKAALSHTGALAGSYALAEGVMKQAGITLVDRSDEILPITETLSMISDQLPLKGKNIAVLADGGGHAAISADCLDDLKMGIPTLSDQTQEKLRKILPSAAAVGNPVDVAGGTDSNPEVFADCAQIMLDDPDVDALLVCGLFGGYAVRFNEALLDAELKCAERLPEIRNKTGKPILLHSLYEPMHTKPLMNLHNSGVPVFHSLNVATQCLASAVDYSLAQKRLKNMKSTSSVAKSGDTSTLISNALAEDRNCLYEYEGLDALAAYGANIVKPIVIRTKDDLKPVIASGSDDNRWVMKIVSRDILHKTDANGVKLNLKNSDLESAYDTIIASAKAYNASADIHGVLLVPMATTGGVEVIIGVTNDPQFGPVMMFGLGGIFVEVLKDVSFRALPVSEDDAQEMFAELKASKVLGGVRGRAAADLKALTQLIVSVSNLCLNHPEIDELDLNPVLARANDYCLLDARVILKTDNGVSHGH